MLYKNTNTGAILDSPCVISGGNWVEYAQEVPEVVKNNVSEVEKNDLAAPKDSKVPEQEKPSGEIKDFTKDEIMQELDAFGIDYNPKSKKQELYDLMMAGVSNG